MRFVLAFILLGLSSSVALVNAGERVTLFPGQYGLSLGNVKDLACFQPQRGADEDPAGFVLWGNLRKVVVEPSSHCLVSLSCLILEYNGDSETFDNFNNGMNNQLELSKCSPLIERVKFRCDAEKVKDTSNPLGECKRAL